METTGTDVTTFISGIHENYLTSCTRGNDESSADFINGCIESLSDGDLLSTDRRNNSTGRNSFGTSDGLRQEELAFHVAVRGVLLSLPNPVRRPAGKSQIYFPMALRLWRDKEIIEGIISLFVAENGISAINLSSNNIKNKSDEAQEPTAVIGATAKLETLLDNMPYLHKILSGKQPKSHYRPTFPSPAMRNLEKVVLFRGVGDQSERIPEENDKDGAETVLAGEEDALGNVKVENKVRRVKDQLGGGQYGGRFQKRKDGGMGILGISGEHSKKVQGVVGANEDENIKGLILSDDDIEDVDD